MSSLVTTSPASRRGPHQRAGLQNKRRPRIERDGQRQPVRRQAHRVHMADQQARRRGDHRRETMLRRLKPDIQQRVVAVAADRQPKPLLSPGRSAGVWGSYRQRFFPNGADRPAVSGAGRTAAGRSGPASAPAAPRRPRHRCEGGCRSGGPPTDTRPARRRWFPGWSDRGRRRRRTPTPGRRPIPRYRCRPSAAGPAVRRPGGAGTGRTRTPAPSRPGFRTGSPPVRCGPGDAARPVRGVGAVSVGSWPRPSRRSRRSCSMPASPSDGGKRRSMARHWSAARSSWPRPIMLSSRSTCSIGSSGKRFRAVVRWASAASQRPAVISICTRSRAVSGSGGAARSRASKAASAASHCEICARVLAQRRSRPAVPGNRTQAAARWFSASAKQRLAIRASAWNSWASRCSGKAARVSLVRSRNAVGAGRTDFGDVAGVGLAQA